MLAYPNEKIAVFIDGANLYATTKALDFDIDYRRLLTWLSGKGQLIRANYYTALSDDSEEFCPLRPLIDWLNYNGFRVVTKPAKECIDPVSGRRKFVCDTELEMAVDMMELAPHVDHVVLFSGDGDYTYLLAAMQRKGIRTTVVSSIATQPSMISDTLRKTSDFFVDITDIQNEIERVSTGKRTPEPA